MAEQLTPVSAMGEAGGWLYDATVNEVIDGDTVQCDVDLGFRVHVTMTVRMWGIDAPEKSTEPGKAANTMLAQLLPCGKAITLRSIKDRTDKYGGRWLGTIIAGGRNINEYMVEMGHAKPWAGHGPKPQGVG